MVDPEWLQTTKKLQQMRMRNMDRATKKYLQHMETRNMDGATMETEIKANPERKPWMWW